MLSYSFSQETKSWVANKLSPDKHPKLFERIADSLESPHSFKNYPVGSDSAMYAKGFVLSINKIRRTNKISVVSHHFIRISEARTYSYKFDWKGVLINSTFYKRDSLYYFMFGDKTDIFGLSTNSDRDKINKTECDFCW